MRTHCPTIADQYEKLAYMYDRLADLSLLLDHNAFTMIRRAPKP